MKKIFFLTIVLGLLLSACGTSQKPATQGGTAAVLPSPAAAVTVDLQATAAVMVQQTIQAMPTPTLVPSSTPEVFTETPTGIPILQVLPPTDQMVVTATQNPILLTLTATLGTGTPITVIPQDPPTTYPGAPTGTEYPRSYGTMPPYLAYGYIYLFNKTKEDATISLHCTTSEGYVTIIEYPVKGKMKIKGPAGNYIFIAWVGGQKFTGGFTLKVDHDASVIMYKDHTEVKVK